MPPIPFDQQSPYPREAAHHDNARHHREPGRASAQRSASSPTPDRPDDGDGDDGDGGDGDGGDDDGEGEPPPPRRYLPTRLVARRYRVHRRTIPRWVDNGTLPPPDLTRNNRHYWREDRLDAHDRRRTVEAAARPAVVAVPPEPIARPLPDEMAAAVRKVIDLEAVADVLSGRELRQLRELVGDAPASTHRQARRLEQQQP